MFFSRSQGRFTAHRHRRPAIITLTEQHLTEPNSTKPNLPEQRLTAPTPDRQPPRRWRKNWQWFVLPAVLLHAAVIALFFISFRPKMQEASQSPPGVSVVFDNGGASQTSAPQHQVVGPPEQAQAPPPSAPPPPPADQPQVRLDIPDMPLTAASAPQPKQPTQAARNQARPARPVQHYMVMNNMSLGAPSPPVPFQKRALNLELNSADQDSVDGPELSIKGDVGADWNAALDQWVEDHKYYPDSAAEQGQQGSVRIRFNVDRAGNVTGLQMLSRSGSAFLDQAWFGLFKDAQLPPFPPGSKANTVSVDATMHYMLVH